MSNKHVRKNEKRIVFALTIEISDDGKREFIFSNKGVPIGEVICCLEAWIKGAKEQFYEDIIKLINPPKK